MNPFNRETQPLQWSAWDAGYAAGVGKISRNEMGGKIAYHRQAAGITMREIADVMGVSIPTVWAWEKGNSIPLPKRIPALAAVLGVSPSVFEKGAKS